MAEPSAPGTTPGPKRAEPSNVVAGPGHPHPYAAGVARKLEAKRRRSVERVIQVLRKHRTRPAR